MYEFDIGYCTHTLGNTIRMLEIEVWKVVLEHGSSKVFREE